jgi:WD40 repeat protein
MTVNGPPISPFVGLRPFRSDESLLFFGRRDQTAELLDRLHYAHFLAVVGSSGCGKSSLVLAGLIPALRGGFLVADRDQWTEIAMTPGKNPLARLAREFRVTEIELREGGAPALVEKLTGQPDSAERNCFLLIDQFEELFRFAVTAEHREDAADFVSIVLALAEQRNFPVFVTLTMRSDFLGDCDPFYGLPEAFNRGQYLVPRLSRQQRREAIEGPIRIFDRAITAQLVDRVLNDVGDEPDQLPVMEHALMRTWENWQAAGSTGPLDLKHYLAVGTAKEALSDDAKIAMGGMSPAEVTLTRTLFKALTDTDASNRRIRRPVRLSEVALVSGSSISEVRGVIERFRSGGRSFLNVREEPESVDAMIDISHESLIRQWTELREWVDEEAEKKRVYLDLVNAVEHRKALLRDPDLQVALAWREHTRPTAEWASRYSPDFAKVMAFVDASRDQEKKDIEEKARAAAKNLRRTQLTVAVVFALLVVAIVTAGFAFYQWRVAVQQTGVAKDATDTIMKERDKEAEISKNLAKLNIDLKDQIKRADTNAALSDSNAKEAAGERTKAEANARTALANAQEAQANAARADENAKEAKANAAKADESAKEAQANAKVAATNAQDAEKQRNQAVAATTTANLLLAQALVQYAGRLVDDKRSDEAMASLSRALEVNGKSLDARSWILNLLLNGGFRPTGARDEPFIHAPWVLDAKVQSVTYSPDGRYIATGSWDHLAQIWDAKTFTKVGKPLEHTNIVNSVAFSTDDRLVTASADKTIRLWEVAKPQPITTSTLKGPAVSAVFSPDGLRVLTASLEKPGVNLWNPKDGKVFPFPISAPASFAAFCPDGNQRLVVIASWDKPAEVRDESGEILASLGPAGKVRSAQFSSDCKRVVTASADNSAQVWDWSQSRAIGAAMQHNAPVNSAAFSHDGLRVVTASDDKSARVWDAGTGVPIGAPLVHKDRVMSAAFSPDGQRVVTGAYDKTVRIWDVSFEFDDTHLIAQLAEALSGYKSDELPDKIQKLTPHEQEQRINQVRTAATHPSSGAASTAVFLRWFLAISN